MPCANSDNAAQELRKARYRDDIIRREATARTQPDPKGSTESLIKNQVFYQLLGCVCIEFLDFGFENVDWANNFDFVISGQHRQFHKKSIIVSSAFRLNLHRIS